MKKNSWMALVVMFSMSSCMFVGYGGKKPLFLVGAADDIQVKHNGKKIDVKALTMANLVSYRVGNVKERVRYKHPAALIKCRKTNKIELTSGGKTVNVNVVGKSGKGILFLILETPITLGIGTIVDLATVSFFYPESKYFDVRAAFNKTKPSDKKELYNMALENSEKEHITEIQTR